MINLHDIRYARLGTADLESAVKFASEIVGLQLVAREGKSAYFRSDKVDVRGDTRDHTLVYFEGDPADQTLGLELGTRTTSMRSRRHWSARSGPCISARGRNAIPPLHGVHCLQRSQRQPDRDSRAALQQRHRFRPAVTSGSPASAMSPYSAPIRNATASSGRNCATRESRTGSVTRRSCASTRCITRSC